MSISKLFTLPLLAIVGTITGWYITNLFIIDISLGEFFMIELIVSFNHYLYNLSKK